MQHLPILLQNAIKIKAISNSSQKTFLIKILQVFLLSFFSKSRDKRKTLFVNKNGSENFYLVVYILACLTVTSTLELSHHHPFATMFQSQFWLLLGSNFIEAFRRDMMFY